MSVPPIIINLVADLRDRRLLPVVIGLVVAIIAVPFLLGGGGQGPVAETSSSAALAGEGPTGAPEPVVLASVEDVRAYRERLKAYEKKDPFEPIAKPEDAEPAKRSANTPRVVDPVVAPIPGGMPTPTDPAPTPLPDPMPTSAPDPDPDPDSAPNPAPDPDEDPAPEPKLLTPVVDVAVGPERQVEGMRRVNLGDYLPNRADPIAQYVEGSLNGKNATFLLSPAARSFEGDGRCEPDRTKCKAIVLEPGETAHIYDEIGTRYTLKLAEIRVIEISKRDLDDLDFEPGFPTKRKPAFEILPTTISPPPSL